MLGGGPDESQLPEEERGRFRLDENSMGLAKGRFWLATLMQMTLPGVPSIYYGDEYALEGLSDPGNRRTLPTPDAVHDRDMLNMVRNTIMLRRALPFLIDGTLDAFAYNDDVLCYRRRGSDGQVASVLINHSLSDARSVRVPHRGDFALDLISGSDLKRGPMAARRCVYGHSDRRWCIPVRSSACKAARARRRRHRAYHLTSQRRSCGHPRCARSLLYRSPRCHRPALLAGLAGQSHRLLRLPYAGPSAFAGNPNLLEETTSELKRAFERFKAEGGFYQPRVLRVRP